MPRLCCLSLVDKDTTQDIGLIQQAINHLLPHVKLLWVYNLQQGGKLYHVYHMHTSYNKHLQVQQ